MLIPNSNQAQTSYTSANLTTIIYSRQSRVHARRPTHMGKMNLLYDCLNYEILLYSFFKGENSKYIL